jgi:hypothetical protein
MIDQETLLPSQEFKSWTKEVRPKIKKRHTFLRSLREFVRCLGLPDQNLEPARDIRNKLVHDLRFPSQDSEQADSRAMFQEYCLLLNLAERILLALLGYTGFYVDWRKFGHWHYEMRTQMEYRSAP